MAQREGNGRVARDVIEELGRALDTLAQVVEAEPTFTPALETSKPHILQALTELRGTVTTAAMEHIEMLGEDERGALDRTLTTLAVPALLRAASGVAFSPSERATASTPRGREEIGGIKDFIKEIIEEILELLPMVSPGLRKILNFVLKLINKLQGKF